MKVLYGAFALLVFIYLAYTVYAAIGAWMCAQVEKKKRAATSAKATAHDEHKYTHTKYNSHYIMAER